MIKNWFEVYNYVSQTDNKVDKFVKNLFIRFFKFYEYKFYLKSYLKHISADICFS